MLPILYLLGINFNVISTKSLFAFTEQYLGVFFQANRIDEIHLL